MANLAAAYGERIEGDPEKNLNRSTELQVSALSRRLQSGASPDTVVNAFLNVALSYADTRAGHRTDNIERSIAYLEAGLEIAKTNVLIRETQRLAYELADMLPARPRGDRADNIDRALGYLNVAQTLPPYSDDTSQKTALLLKGVELLQESTVSRQRSDVEHDQRDICEFWENLLRVSEEHIRDVRASGSTKDIIHALERSAQSLADSLPTQADEDTPEWFDEKFYSLERAADRIDEAIFLLSSALKRRYLGRLKSKVGQYCRLAGMISSMVDHIKTDQESSFSPLESGNSKRTNDVFLRSLAAFDQAISQHAIHSYTRTLGGTYLQRGQVNVALRNWEAAANDFDEAIRLMSIEALQLPITRDEHLEALSELSAAIELGSIAHLQAFGVDEAIDFSDRARAQGLAKGLSVRSLGFDKATLKRIDNLHDELQQIEVQLKPVDVSNRLELMGRVKDLRIELDDINKQFDWQTHHQASNTSKLEKLVEPRTALIHPLFAPYLGAAICVDYPDGNLRKTYLGTDSSFEMSRLFTDRDSGWQAHYEAAFQAPAGKAHDVSFLEQGIQAASRKLADVLKPDEWPWATEPSVSKLIIIPNGDLASLPINCTPLNDGKELIDRYEVTFLPSIRTGVELKKEKCDSAEGGFCIVASEDHLKRRKMDIVARECQMVEAMLAPSSVRYIDATETNAASEVLTSFSGASSWHIPGHAVFNLESPGESSLEITDDADIKLKDIWGLYEFQAPRLVTMMNCESGLFERQNVPSELLGWPSAFLQLGAKGVISTLWPVETLPTMLLSVKFYELFIRQGLSASAALRSAQLWLRESSIGTFIEATEDWANNKMVSARDFEELKRQLIAILPTRKDVPFPAPNFWAAYSYWGDSELYFED